jgi:hypothetical protein
MSYFSTETSLQLEELKPLREHTSEAIAQGRKSLEAAHASRASTHANEEHRRCVFGWHRGTQ